MSKHEIEITVIVNGHPLMIKVNVQEPLRAVVKKALDESGNSGQPLDNWELRDASGQVLDLNRKVADYGIENGAKLYLNLKAGVGGDQPIPQYADPTVSRRKFDREVAEFRNLGNEYRQRGWLLVQAEYPRALVLLASPKLTPSAIICGVSFDYTNYDAAPPSVRLVHPFTAQPYKASEMPMQLMRALPQQQIQLPGMPEGAPQLAVLAQQPLLQAQAADDIPFLCLAGVREYHEHPAHSGDQWELHRSGGAGRLVRLLEIVSKYGLDLVVGFSVQMVPTVGFRFGAPPP